MKNINNFLNAVSAAETVKVYLPCLQKTVSFKSLSAKQINTFRNIKNDASYYDTGFIKATYKIIQENCIDASILDKITVVDKNIILLELRKQARGSLVDEGVNYSSTLRNIKDIVLPEQESVTVDVITLDLQVPLAKEQYEIEAELRNTAIIEIEQVAQNIVTSNLIKFIKEVKINNIPQNYKTLSYKDRMLIVEHLPSAFLALVQKYAVKVDELNAFLTQVKLDDNETYSFNIDSDFFLGL